MRVRRRGVVLAQFQDHVTVEAPLGDRLNVNRFGVATRLLALTTNGCNSDCAGRRRNTRRTSGSRSHQQSITLRLSGTLFLKPFLVCPEVMAAAVILRLLLGKRSRIITFLQMTLGQPFHKNRSARYGHRKRCNHREHDPQFAHIRLLARGLQTRKAALAGGAVDDARYFAALWIVQAVHLSAPLIRRTVLLTVLPVALN